jgi:hypothetical protein
VKRGELLALIVGDLERPRPEHELIETWAERILQKIEYRMVPKCAGNPNCTLGSTPHMYKEHCVHEWEKDKAGRKPSRRELLAKGTNWIIHNEPDLTPRQVKNRINKALKRIRDTSKK